MTDQPQYMVALAGAERIRLARAETKREVRAGVLSIAEAMERECCKNMRVDELLGAQSQWGPVRAEKFLRELMIAPHRTVASITERQRGLIADALGNRQAVA